MICDHSNLDHSLLLYTDTYRVSFRIFIEGGTKATITELRGNGKDYSSTLYIYEHVYENKHPRDLLEI